MILLDTNILVRLACRSDPQYQLTHDAIKGCLRKDRRLVIAHQTIHEFWAVATRPLKKNGLAMPTTTADRYVTRFLRLFTLIDDPPGLFVEWRGLVNRLNVQGLPSYDARLAVFAMLLNCHGVMTYNVDDFAPFPVHIVNTNDPSTW